MDPQACWNLILGNLIELQAFPDEGYSDTRSETVSALRDLAEWLDRAGFPPKIKPRRDAHGLTAADWGVPR